MVWHIQKYIPQIYLTVAINAYDTQATRSARLCCSNGSTCILLPARVVVFIDINVDLKSICSIEELDFEYRYMTSLTAHDSSSKEHFSKGAVVILHQEWVWKSDR